MLISTNALVIRAASGMFRVSTKASASTIAVATRVMTRGLNRAVGAEGTASNRAMSVANAKKNGCATISRLPRITTGLAAILCTP